MLSRAVSRLWDHRALVRIMTLSQLRTEYSRTVLGSVWWLLDPILMTVVYTVLVGYVLDRGANYPPFPLFLMCGLVAWKGFAACMTKSVLLMPRSEGLLSSFRFPRAVIPVTMVLSNQIFFLVALVPLFGLTAYYQFIEGSPNAHLGGALVFAPIVFAVQVTLALGISVLLSCVGVYFRDLSNVMRHATRVLWYASPGIYATSDVIPGYEGLASIDGSKIEHLFVLNPFVHVIDGYRRIFMEGRAPDFAGLALAGAFGIALVLVSLTVFERRESDFLKRI